MSKSAKTKVSQRGQVVIPKSIRDRLGLERGQILEVEESEGVIRLLPSLQERVRGQGWRRWRGALEGTDALQDLEAEHRAEVARGR